MKRKKQPRSTFCPSCKNSYHRSEFRTVAKHLQVAEGHDLFENFLEYSLGFACDGCLKTKKAILANPKAQFGSFFYHLAYFDESRTCQTCEGGYIFSKEEKRHWFEKLQFWVYAKSVNCQSCSKEIRTAKNLNTRLSELLKDGETELTQAAIAEIVSIYELMEKPEKVKYFQSKLEQ